MRDKRMTEFTGRQMVIRLAPTRRVLVGKDVTHSDAVHDASVYDMRRDVETLRPLTSNVDAYSLMMQDVNDTNLYAAVGRCSEVFREMYRWAFRSYDSAFTVYRLPSSRAGFKLYMVLADGRIATKRVAVMMGWPVVRGRFILLPERVDVLTEIKAFISEDTTPRPLDKISVPLMTRREMEMLYTEIQRLVRWYNVQRTPTGDWLFIGHYTEMRRRLGMIDGNNNLVHEMRVVLATMRGDGWQDYNTVAREETSLPAAIERLTNSTPISPMYGIRDSPITLAYAEGYTLRGGTL